MNELINELEEEKGFIYKTWIWPRFDIRLGAVKTTARQWIKAINRDIEGLKSGKYTYTLDDYYDAVQFENNHYAEAKVAFENLTGADYDDLTWAEKIDTFEMMK